MKEKDFVSPGKTSKWQVELVTRLVHADFPGTMSRPVSIQSCPQWLTFALFEKGGYLLPV
jgi:hypothetical protein